MRALQNETNNPLALEKNYGKGISTLRACGRLSAACERLWYACGALVLVCIIPTSHDGGNRHILHCLGIAIKP